MNESELELFRQHRDAQLRYTYFLLAAAASGIALSIRFTEDATLQWRLLPIGAAVLCSALSFFHGCRYLQYGQSITYSNVELLKVERGDHPLVGNIAWKMAAASRAFQRPCRRTLPAQASTTTRSSATSLQAGCYLLSGML
jgi:hypothetical protein